MGAGVGLDRCGGAPVGVALAQDRVDGAALDGVVAGAHPALEIGGHRVGVVGQAHALVAQLADRGFELGQGGGDVREFDDCRAWGSGQRAESGQVVVGQFEGGQDAARQ